MKNAAIIQPSSLRRRAEELLEKQGKMGKVAADDIDIRRILHELAVHNIELEMQLEELHRDRDETQEALLARREDGIQTGLEIQIEELKRSRLEIETRMIRYVELYDFAPTGYLTLDPHGIVCQANLAAANFLGIPRGDLVGRSFETRLADSTQRTFRAFLSRVFETQATERYEVDLPRRGAQPPRCVCIDAAADPSRETCRLALLDITKRKEMERKMVESEERYERAVNGANDGIWEWIPATGENYLSARFKKLLGYQDHELPNVQINFSDRIHPKDKPKVLRTVSAHLRKKKPYNTELRLQCKNGEYRWFNSRGQAIWDEQCQLLRMVGSITDITERKTAEEKILEMSESLEKQVNVRTQQLRTLLLELAMTEERERYKLAQDLHDNLSQLLAVIKIKLTTLDAGSLQAPIDDIVALVDKADVSARMITKQLNPLILRTLGFLPALEVLADELKRTYNLTVYINSDTGETISLCYEVLSMLYRSIRELLINVAKHAKVNNANISCLSDENQLTLAVSDDGCGFDAANTYNQWRKRNNFGLHSICERIANIGGEVDISSSPGQGTMVVMVIPYFVEGKDGRPMSTELLLPN
ncbi:putative Nitrogen regulation protein B [Gammaproteobacteria bacterium]